MRRRRFRPALDALEGRLPLSEADGMDDPFVDPFVPAEVDGIDAADWPADEAGPATEADPFGPDLDPTEPEPPDFDGPNPPGEFLPPAPIGPAGPA